VLQRRLFRNRCWSAKRRAPSPASAKPTRGPSIAAKRFAAAIYPDHPYGVPPTVETSAISREDLMAFIAGITARGRRRFHHRRRVARRGRGHRAAPDGGTARWRRAGPPPVRRRGEPRAVPHPAAQATSRRSARNRRGDPDYFPLLVGNYTLGGGGFVSRLMKEVREKRGYAYSVYSYVPAAAQA
jgi:zinc protease